MSSQIVALNIIVSVTVFNGSVNQFAVGKPKPRIVVNFQLNSSSATMSALKINRAELLSE